MLEGLAQALERFLAEWGYIAIFLLMLVEEAGIPLPLPNEVALMYVGYLASRGELDANVAALAATLGAANGSTLLYLLAKRGGRPLLRRFGRFIHLRESGLDRAESWVARFGLLAVPLARLTPGLRIYTTVVAGILRVPFRVVVAAVVGASLVWSYFWVYLGKSLGDNWEEGARTFERAGRWGFLLVALTVAAILLIRWLLRRRAASRMAEHAMHQPLGPAPANKPEPPL